MKCSFYSVDSTGVLTGGSAATAVDEMEPLNEVGGDVRVGVMGSTNHSTLELVRSLLFGREREEGADSRRGRVMDVPLEGRPDAASLIDVSVLDSHGGQEFRVVCSSNSAACNW